MEAKLVKDLMEAYASIYDVQSEDIVESDIGDRTRRVVRDQRQGVHGDADAMKRDMDATRDNLLKLRPYGAKGFPSAKKDTEKTTQVAHFEPEGELVDEGLGAKAAELVDKGTKAIQSGLEKVGVPINRQKRGTVTKAEQEDRIKGNVKEETDLFDVILEYLVAEGYADTNQSALVIMANMSEDWRQNIVETIAGGGYTPNPVGNAIRTGAGLIKSVMSNPSVQGAIKTGSQMLQKRPAPTGGYSTRPGDGKPYKDGPLWGPGSSDSPSSPARPKPQVKKEPPMRDEPLW